MTMSPIWQILLLTEPALDLNKAVHRFPLSEMKILMLGILDVSTCYPCRQPSPLYGYCTIADHSSSPINSRHYSTPAWLFHLSIPFANLISSSVWTNSATFLFCPIWRNFLLGKVCSPMISTDKLQILNWHSDQELMCSGLELCEQFIEVDLPLKLLHPNPAQTVRDLFQQQLVSVKPIPMYVFVYRLYF